MIHNLLGVFQEANRSSQTVTPKNLRKNARALMLFGLSLIIFLGSWGVAQEGARIAFITFKGELATMDAWGADKRILSSAAQRFQFPAWSPDGTKIAALGADDESAGFITVFEDEDSGDLVELYRSRTQGPFYLYWSPNSKRLSFLANHPTAGIALHIASESVPDQILALGSPLYWHWTSDSQQLLIHSGLNRANARLGFSSRVRDTLEDNLAAPGRFQAPGISASGRYLAYAVEDLEGPRVILANNPLLNNETLERELPHQGLAAMTWSPIKDQLAVMSPLQNSDFFFGPISLLDAETGLLEPLSSQVALAFFWSPDGRYLAYLSPSQGGTSADVGSDVQLVSRDLQKVQLSGLLSLNIIDTQTQTEIELATFPPSPTFIRQFLPFFDQYALSHSLWSPNSDAIVLPVRTSETIEVTVFGLDGSVTSLGEGDSPFWNRK